MFDLLLESSHRDDSNKRSNLGFGQEIMEFASIEVYFTHIIWSSAYLGTGLGSSMFASSIILLIFKKQLEMK